MAADSRDLIVKIIMLAQLFNLALAVPDWSHSCKGSLPMVLDVSCTKGRGGRLPL